jgi:hypothetical protein
MEGIRETVTGYLHPRYAGSLAEFGVPRALPRSGAWVLQRAIPSVPLQDAMGCYPLFACCNWSGLAADLEKIAHDVVCLSVVTDPFGEYDEAQLRQCFQDKVVAFKKHFCIDLRHPMEEYVHRDHQRKARKALARLQVERCENAPQCLDEWVRLYEHLIQRHRITGISTFSRMAFARQFEVPGLVAFRALHQDKPVGMVLCYLQGDIAYYHLGAHSPAGYETGSSFALFWRLIEYLRDRGLRWVNLGAGAGTAADATDGLTRFKRGWSTGTRTAYFCGRIFDRRAYDRIVESKGIAETAYFPAYRKGEFH